MKKKYKIKKVPFLILLLVIIITISIPTYVYISKADIRKLSKIGYDSNEIKLIKDNKIDVSIFDKYGYIEKINEILNNKDYIEDNLTRYLDLYASDRDIDIIIYIVNNDIKYEYTDKLVSLIKAKYFVLNNLDRYMNYDKETDYNLIIRDVNSNIDSDFYTNTKEADVSKGILMLVNKYYYLDKDYHYGDLVKIEANYANNSNGELNKEAYEAFKELVDAAETGGYHIRSNYAYRSYDYQSGVYNSYLKSGEAYADSISARPGFSEHQTGLSLDVGVQTRYAKGKFQDSKEFTWMKDNCYKYGFILRYPEGKQNITGYNYEAWHYRYVGVDAATYIHDNDITFEEYYAYFVEK